jgi:two-component system, OmpR family, sensor histidine kinase BaeS
MSHEWWREHRARWQAQGGRPPWWPENEPFPPEGRWARPPWGRRRFMGRIVALFMITLVLLVAGATFLFLLFASALGASDLGGTVARAVALLLVFIAIATVGRSLRRLAAPVADVIEAVGKVADGDLSVRVEERGPRETRHLARSFNTMTARLRASEEERRRLLADVSHELRTPLSVVRGELEALIDGVHPADEAHLRAILDETAVLDRLIEDLRTLSVAEAGALALHREPTDLGSLAREVAASFEPQAEAAGVSLETSAAPGLPEADVDPVRVREILTNLISNALRYSPRGGRVGIDVAADGARAIAVSVSDAGPGIAPEALARIFDRFYKSPESRGAGLGLAIAKQLTEAHGGTIAATSVVGQGTTIRFTLPVER